MSKLPKRWSPDEDHTLRNEVERQLAENHGEVRSWKEVADRIPGRNNKDCRKRYYNEVMGGFKKGPWTKDEDDQLMDLVTNLGPAWAAVSKRMKNRTADQCSKRWNHSLDPNLDHSAWTPEENVLLSIAAKVHGSLWKDIQAIHFSERSTNNIKNQYTILSRKGFQAPPNSTSCCEKRAKRRAVDPDDYDQGHMTEESVEPSDLIQMDTGEATAHTPNFNHTFDSTGLFDGTGYNSFLDGFQMHDNTFAAEKQTFQSPPTSQINDFHFPASAGDFAELQPFHEFPAKNSSGSDQTTHVNPVASSRHSGGVSYIPQQRSNAARNPLPESPANEVLSTLKSASSDRATVCLDDDMSDSDEATAEPPVQSDQPRSRQKRRITITLEHADPKTLASFLNAALQSKAKISFETNDFGR